MDLNAALARICAAPAVLALALSLISCGVSPSETPQPAKHNAGIAAVAEAGVQSATEQIIRGIPIETEVQRPERLRERLVDVANAESATVMLYLIGSDLESSSGLATKDLEEIMRADLGDSVNFVVQTMGCHKWHNDSISPASAQRFTVEDGSLVCLEADLGQLDSTDPATLQDFISYCNDNYPADRNILILWDHGGGPVYGFGYDEFRPSSAALTLDEVQTALREAGVFFDFIGFDACLMGCLETGCALYDWADYLISSEDFTSGYGWEYQYWLTELGDNVTISTEKLGRTIVDTFVTESELAGEAGILTLLDLQYMPPLYSAWTSFAYANEAALTGTNYSWQTESNGRGFFSDWAEAGEPETTMRDYYITDLMALASTLKSEESTALTSALSAAVVYSASTAEDSAYTGLSVTLPYGDASFYADLRDVFLNCGLESDYVDWLGRFTTADGSNAFYDHWADWSEQWDNSSQYGGWASREDSYQWNGSSHGWSHFGWDTAWQEGETNGNGEVGEGFHYDSSSKLYYYVYSDGDIQYYQKDNDTYYYWSASEKRWLRWNDGESGWTPAENPGFSTALEHP